ncbi:hypothetical protein CTI12_AA073690 [Artemisia annua]|uniref:Uncharacterized protein n=1 Tax=Artemisia annua TaxID=35608 RepID=A0A2U1Q579_ARTAN|nr:hypothetical protein CTI12_AA073690 [Artemisia annua]
MKDIYTSLVTYLGDEASATSFSTAASEDDSSSRITRRFLRDVLAPSLPPTGSFRLERLLSCSGASTTLVMRTLSEDLVTDGSASGDCALGSG